MSYEVNTGVEFNAKNIVIMATLHVEKFHISILFLPADF